MNTIQPSSLPPSSLLNVPNHFQDSFETILDHATEITPTLVGKTFFSGSPAWVGKLFTLRNKLVGAIGLKTGEEGKGSREAQLEAFQCQPGEQLGLFKVFTNNEQEVILGEDDKHLNFRISLFLEPMDADRKKLILSTTVVFHNNWGRLYFLPVKPFHRKVVPAMMKKIVANLNRHQSN